MAGNDASIADVLKSALQDAQDLVRGEIALARAELREEISRIRTGAIALSAAAIAGLLGVVFLLTAAAWAISETLAWPVWAGFAMVGAVVTLAAGVLVVIGRKKFNGERRMRLTIDTMKENMQWMQGQRP